MIASSQNTSIRHTSGNRQTEIEIRPKKIAYFFNARPKRENMLLTQT